MRIIKFGAIWCPGCLVMKPIWAEIEKENPDLKSEYFDFDRDKKEVKQFKITTILPVFIFLDDKNKEILRISGEKSKKELQKIVDNIKNE